MNHQQNEQNIWEIISLNDMVRILKESPKKFVIIGITLQSTPDSTSKMIKKFLKQKSKLYPNITFLYFKAKDSDLGRISLLDKNKEQYPYVYHVYDTSQIFVSVNIANEETTYQAFSEVEDYYKADKDVYLKNLYNSDTSKNININKNLLNPNPNNNLNENVNSNVHSNVNCNENLIEAEPNDEVEAEAEQQRQMIEQKKMLEKILLLQKHAKDFNIKFLGVIQDRKKREKKDK
jgi:hypothetical protein